MDPCKIKGILLIFLWHFTSLPLITGDHIRDGGTNQKAPSASLTYPGDIYIAVFVDLHWSSNSTDPICGDLNTAAVQQLWSAIWAVDTLNNQTEPGMPKLGLKVYDTCNNPMMSLKQTMGFLQSTISEFPSWCDTSTKPQRQTPINTMLGIIGIGEAATLKPILGLLQVYSVPLVLATPNAASGLPAQSNVLTTAPTMASLVQALLSLLTELHFKSIYAMSTSPAAIHDLSTSIVNRDMTLVQAITLAPDGINADTVDDILSAKKLANQRVFILMLEPNEIDRLVDAFGDRLPSDDNSIWIVATTSMDKQKVARWSQHVFKRGFIVSPHPIYLQDYRSSFLNALSGRGKGRPVAINNYLRQVYNCVPDDSSKQTLEKQVPCSTLSYTDLQAGFHQDPSVPFVSKAVSALAASLRLVQIGRCPELGTRCVNDGLKGYPIFQDILDALMKLSFTIQGNEPMEVEGTRLKFTEDGKLLFKHFDVYTFNGSSLPVQVGWYSDNIGLNINVGWQQQSSGTNGLYHHTITELEVTAVDADQSEQSDIERDSMTEVTGKTLVNVLHYSDSSLGTFRLVTTAMTVITSIGIFTTFYMFVYIVIKIWDRTLIGNQFLTILLLLGVISMYSTCFIYVLPTSEAICNWRPFMHSVSYTLCYGVLLLKVMQLKSQVTLGLGGQVSHLNQAITLLFIVGLQVALNVQWSVLRRPVFGFSDESGDFHCLVTRTDFACLQAYVLVLLTFVCGYSIHTRHIKRNQNEGRLVLVASLINVPVWLAWMTAYISSTELQETDADLIICAGLITDASLLVGIVFVPKLKTLSIGSRTGSTANVTSSSSYSNGTPNSQADISSTNSTITVFSLDGIGRKSSKMKSTFPSSMFAESLLRNPLYDFRDKTLPKKLHSIAESRSEK